MTESLTDWLAAVHAADEQTARAVEGWDEAWSGAAFHGHVLPWRHARFVARHDPQATLARIEGERLVIALHRPDSHRYGSPRSPGPVVTVCPLCSDADDGIESSPCPTLRALAWGYRRRAEWRAEWTPEGVEVGA